MCGRRSFSEPDGVGCGGGGVAFIFGEAEMIDREAVPRRHNFASLLLLSMCT